MHETYFVPLIIFGTLVFVMFVFILTTFIIIHRQKLRQHALEKKETEYHYQNFLLQTRLEVEELALKTVSSEIHDNVNQILGIVRMSLFHARRVNSPGEIDELISDANDMVGEAIDNLRNLSHTLSGAGVNSMGLIKAVKKELANIAAHSEISTDLVCEEEELPISDEQEILIFRIIQEALNNVVKHAQARQIIVAIALTKDQLQISIADDGKGLNSSEDNQQKGIGLINMHERAKLLKGRLVLGSGLAGGCTVHLQMTITGE